MKRNEDVMEILEAFDLTESYEAAARLAGCDPKTVRRYVAARVGGIDAYVTISRDSVVDPYLDKIEEWVDHSRADIRADVVHCKLVAMGYKGSERTTRRAVATAKRNYERGHRRIYRPWVPEPGLWFQWDWATGPMIWGRKTSLWCAWLAWSRYRVIIPTWDRTLASVIACLDETLRSFGGVPTYGLTDNEKTVTTERIAGIAVRHSDIVAASRHYGLTIHTCHSGDPETKGGVEATVRIAKADIVPTSANLVEAYDSFTELAAACAEAMDRFNARKHRETGRLPLEMIVEERLRLHRVPQTAHTLAFGKSRTVDRDATIRVGSARYSVPSSLIGEEVWARVAGDELVVVDVSGRGAREAARHELTTPGNPRICDEHYPERSSDPLHPKPKPQTEQERAFLAIGDGAYQWLVEAAAAGVQRMRTKMVEATELRSLVGDDLVDRALGLAAASGRFVSGDLESIVDYLSNTQAASGENVIADGAANLSNSTRAWESFGR